MRSNTKSIAYHRGQSLFSWFYIYILIVTHRIIVWLFRAFPSFTSRGVQSIGTIVIAGDDTACGYGDSIFQSSHGLSCYLPFYLKKERKLRTNWKIFNAGYFGSTSKDWISTAKSNYYNQLKKMIIENNATIVVLLIGANDVNNGISLQETIHNIKCLCKDLSNLGAMIFLCTLPTWGDEGLDEDMASIRDNVNTGIKELIQRNEISRLHLGVDLDKSNFEYRVLKLYASDGVHLSQAGYRKLSGDLAEVLIYPMVKIEFSYFKSKIKGL